MAEGLDGLYENPDFYFSSGGKPLKRSEQTCDTTLPYFRKRLLAPGWRIDCGGARAEARRSGAIIQVSGDGNWERSGGCWGGKSVGVLGVF